jgi:perosamine synthetase
MKNISIAAPVIGEEEKAAVMRILDSGYLVQGAEVAKLEEQFAAYCNAKHGVATSNGTTALTVALMTAGVEPGDEVIIPSFSFVATATSVLGARAKPVFVDIESETFCIDPAKIEAAITEKTKAITPVHLYGQLADMAPIKAIADRHGLAIVEDAAQAHGAECNGKRAGSWGPACFSFYPSKNMTTGEGGMVVTHDDELAATMRMVRNHGMNTQYYHEVIGFNFRMTNIAAAIGVVQLTHLEDWNKKRIANAQYFDANFKTVRPPVVRDGCRHIYHQYTVLVPEGTDRDAMTEQLNDKGIGVRVYYPLPIHKQPVFEKLGYGNIVLPVTEAMTARVFSLPVHPGLSQEDREYIVDAVNAL